MKSFFLFVILYSGGLVYGQQNWTERFAFKGDFRLRAESIDDEVAATGDAHEQNRLRLRARFLVSAKVNDNTDAHFRFASGIGNEVNTTSTNQDLTDYGSKKGLNLDMAYVNWKPSDAAQVWLGKSPLVYYQPGNSDMIFDADVTPEGLSYKSSWKGESMSVFWNAGYWVLSQIHSAGDESSDPTLVGGDLGMTAKFGNFDLTFGGGVLNFANIKDKPVPGGNSGVRGNTIYSDGGENFYARKYDLSRGFLELGTQLFNLPVALYFDYVKNQGTRDDNEGSLVGFRVGKLKDIGSWAFSVDYRDLEADATLGVLAESDTGGGGTNLAATRVVVGYQLADATAVGVAYSTAKRRSATTPDTDYERLMLDMQFYF